MFIDTHCHLDAPEFNGESDQVAARAGQLGVCHLIIPAVSRANFGRVAKLGRFGGYALGIHPLYVPSSDEDDLLFLRTQVHAAMKDPHFIAIGEIGLDFFVPELTTPEMREKQEYFYREQCQIAKETGLPVLLHVRRSVDQILKILRLSKLNGGIAHAFNGSQQQAHMLIQLGFKLGFGGALTYTRALQIRRLAVNLPLSAIVLETDAPDIVPYWLQTGQNSPEQLPRIAQILADLRGISIDELAIHTSNNAYAVLPRLRRGDTARFNAAFTPG